MGNAARPRRRLSLRWKLLFAFVTAFTVVFAFIALWVVHYAGNTALKRLSEQLVEATEGAARDLPPAAIIEVTELPRDAKLSDNAAYQRVKSDLTSVRATLPEARPYVIARGPGDSLDYLVAPAGTFRDPVTRTTPETTLPYMQEAFERTVYQGLNSDEYGQWVTAYSPIVGSQGDTLAVVGMDYPLSYVQNVRAQARAQVLPVLVVSYLALIALVLIVSTFIVRPIRRMTDATRRIADGDYNLDVTLLNQHRFPDELSDLAASFQIMAQKVAAREQDLTSQVQRLQVQIDASKREQTVQEITQTEFFTDLEAKAAQMRARMHTDDE